MGGFLLRTVVEYYNINYITKILSICSFIPFDKPQYFWTFLFSCLIAIVIFYLLEKVILFYYTKDNAIVWAVNKHGDELETLAKDSALYGQTIMLTLKNEKVYIGFFEKSPIPGKTNYLSINPILSGYRDKETKILKITTDYLKVVNEFIEEIEDEKEGEDLAEISLNTDIVIKQDEILTASIYEQNIFDKFNKPNKTGIDLNI